MILHLISATAVLAIGTSALVLIVSMLCEYAGPMIEAVMQEKCGHSEAMPEVIQTGETQ